VKLLDSGIERLDGFQQRRRWTAFPFGVLKKFGEDRGGNLAALIAYYGFFSLFPLLLVLVSILGLVLRNNVSLRASIIDSTLAQFPIIGDQLKTNVTGLSGGGTGVALGLGSIAALWAGLGVTQATQNAMNDVWDVPVKTRPSFLESRLRGLLMLAVLGTMTLGATFLSGLGTATGELGLLLRALGLVGSVALNLGVFLFTYMVLTDRAIPWRVALPGSLFAAIAWSVVQAVGTLYVSHSLRNSTQVYGFFGFVLALLAWIYLGARILILGAEVNVVKDKHLWPRSLKQPPLTEADERTLARKADVEERVPQESVDVDFSDERSGERRSAGGGD
jgi:YihY family inner membrane protein